jgi:hypothetical protein
VKNLFFVTTAARASNPPPSITVDLCLKLLVPLRQPRAIAPQTWHARSRARVSAVPSPEKKARFHNDNFLLPYVKNETLHKLGT